MKVGTHADHKIVSKGEESMTSKWERVEREGLGRTMRERRGGGGGGGGGRRDNVEKNQAKRTHAGGGDKQKVREREETG